jgi:hypothetical protein
LLVFKDIYLISTPAPHSHESGKPVDLPWFPAFTGMRGSAVPVSVFRHSIECWLISM